MVTFPPTFYKLACLWESFDIFKITWYFFTPVSQNFGNANDRNDFQRTLIYLHFYSTISLNWNYWFKYFLKFFNFRDYWSFTHLCPFCFSIWSIIVLQFVNPHLELRRAILLQKGLFSSFSLTLKSLASVFHGHLSLMVLDAFSQQFPTSLILVSMFVQITMSRNDLWEFNSLLKKSGKKQNVNKGHLNIKTT